MKRCPACQKTYGDEQNFCLDDGTTLVADVAGSYGHSSAPTEVMHSPQSPQSPQTAGNRYAPQTSPPPYGAPYTPAYATPQPQKKSPLPWIILGAIVLIGGAVGLILATRGSKETPQNINVTSSTTPGATPRTSPGTRSTPSTVSGVVYNSDDGKFQITLPPGFSAFKSQKQSQPTPAGNIDLTILQTEIPTGACLLGFSDFPAASWVGRTPLKMMEDGRDGALKNINATLEKQNELTVQGKDALDVYGSTSQGGKQIYVRFQFVLDKPRAYQIGYLAYNRADLDKPDVQAYFDSFRIK